MHLSGNRCTCRIVISKANKYQLISTYLLIRQNCRINVSPSRVIGIRELFLYLNLPNTSPSSGPSYLDLPLFPPQKGLHPKAIHNPPSLPYKAYPIALSHTIHNPPSLPIQNPPPEPVPQSQNMGTDFYSEKCDYLPEHSSLSRIQQLVEEIMSKD